jgi:3-phenylpropionate/trans-cinnamate dioxygenase ferredoxin component
VSGLTDVAGVEQLEPGSALRVEVGDTPICLVRVGDSVRAVHDICTHAEFSMSEGWVEDDRIECPGHGAAFDLASGDALTPPAVHPLPTFRVELRDGRVLVDPTPSRPHPLY